MASSSSSDPPQTKKFTLKVNSICCEAHQEKMKKKLGKIEGIDQVEMDLGENKITIYGTVDPKVVIDELKKHFNRDAQLVKTDQPWSSSRGNEDAKLAKKLKDKESVVKTEQPRPSLRDKEKDAKLVKKLENKESVVKTEQPRPSSRDKETTSIASKSTVSPPISSTTVLKTPGGKEHVHEFEQIDNAKPFHCDGCRERGIGVRHRCRGRNCVYELHPQCLSPPEMASHDEFPGLNFKLLSQRPGNHAGQICSACGRDICGSAYHCSTAKRKGLYLHPVCINVKSNLSVGDTNFNLDREGTSRCLWCRKRKLSRTELEAPVWSYVSDSKEKYCLHLCCVTKLVKVAWRKDHKALEVVNLKVIDKKSSGGGMKRGLPWMKMALFVRAVVGLLFGDPTTFLVDVAVALLNK